jgi:hypothetical protein
MSIEAMKQALVALENGKRVRACEGGTLFQPDLEDAAITTLRQAIEQAEKQAALNGLAETSREIEQWDTSDMAHRSGGLSVEQKPVGYFDSNVLQVIHRGSDGWVDKIYSVRTGNYTSPLYAAPLNDLLRQSEQEGWRWARECEAEVKRLNKEHLDAIDRAYFAGKQAGIDEAVKRDWVDLTNDEAAECWSTSAIMTWKRIQDKLRERNT